MRGPVVLLTDFGDQDPFAGIMRGVLAARAPRARVLDLAHGLPPGDIKAAALALRQAVPYFPDGSIFVCVVDPGVGSSRRVIWARSPRAQFLAPDNGVLSWLAADERPAHWRSVTNEKIFLRPVSGTFHGRDKFAPAAAALARGLSPSRLGPEIRDPVTLPWPEPETVKDGLRGQILDFDRFGNALTNIPADAARGARAVFRARDLGPVRDHFAQVPAGRALAVAGSAGLVELAVRDGDFRARLRAKRGDPVHARRP